MACVQLRPSPAQAAFGRTLLGLLSATSVRRLVATAQSALSLRGFSDVSSPSLSTRTSPFYFKATSGSRAELDDAKMYHTVTLSVSATFLGVAVGPFALAEFQLRPCTARAEVCRLKAPGAINHINVLAPKGMLLNGAKLLACERRGSKRRGQQRLADIQRHDWFRWYAREVIPA